MQRGVRQAGSSRRNVARTVVSLTCAFALAFQGIMGPAGMASGFVESAYAETLFVPSSEVGDIDGGVKAAGQSTPDATQGDWDSDGRSQAREQGEGELAGNSDLVTGLTEVFDDGASIPLRAMSADVFDLAALWSAQQDGLTESYTIKSGGTYRISYDLSVEAPLIVDAPGQDVEIDLNGCRLSVVSAATGADAALNVKSARSVTVRGDAQKKSRLIFDSRPVKNTVLSSADELNMYGVTILSTLNTNSGTDTDLSANNVRVDKGNVNISNVTLSVDMSNRVTNRASSNSTSVRGAVANVYLAAAVESATLEKVEGVAKGVRAVQIVDFSDVDDAGWVYGILSKSAGQVVAKDCSFDLCGYNGAAVGACAESLAIETLGTSGFSVNVDAEQAAIAVRSQVAQGVLIDAPLGVTFGDAGSDISAALYSTVENGFLFGSGFQGETLGVYIDTPVQAPNADAVRIARFADELGASERTAAASLIANALGNDASCMVAADADGVYFKLVPENAPVAVEHASQVTPYDSLESALAALQTDDTLRFLADAGSSLLAVPSFVAKCSVDLNGHTVGPLQVSTQGAVAISSAGANGRIAGTDANTHAALTVTGAGDVTVEGVAVEAVSQDTAYGVRDESPGDLTLKDTVVEAVSTAGLAYGVYQKGVSAGSAVLRGGSVFAVSRSLENDAVGCVSEGTGNQLEIVRCPVSAWAVSGRSVGIEARSTVRVLGDAGALGADVSAASGGASQMVCGVVVTRAAARARIESCSIDVRPGQIVSGGAYWCLTNGASKASLTLAGACDFINTADAEINVSGGPLVFESTYSTIVSTLHVDSQGEPQSYFASAPTSALAAEIAGKIAPVAGSSHDGWTVSVRGGDPCELFWTRANIALNATSHEGFSTLEEAVASASEGDTIALLGDVVVNGALQVGKPLTFDLAGHILQIEAGASATSGAMRFSAAGESAITDSGASGKLVVHVGPENQEGNAVYRGLNVAGGGTLALRDCKVEVAYTGSTTLSSAPNVALNGVVVDESTLKLEGAAELEVHAAQADNSFGARTVTAIYALGNDGSVNVSSQASVIADNNAKVNEANASSLYGDVMKLDVEEDDPLYSEIQQQFYRTAVFDYEATDTKANAKYNNRVYYAPNMTLPSGAEVWAYSDPVPVEQAGKREAVKAAHFFVETKHDVAQQAYGISSASGYSGSIVQAGSVNAATTAGYAYALFKPADAVWTSDESKLSSSCSASSFRLLDGQFNLADFVSLDRTTIDGEAVNVKYLGNDKLYGVGYVHSVNSVARSVADQGTSYVVDAGGNAGMDVVRPDYPETVSAVFTGRFDSDGHVADDAQVAVPFGDTLASAGLALPASEDYVRDGRTYRFVGWRLAGDSYTYDPAYLLSDLVIDDDVAGAPQGTCTFSAVYVPVGSDEALVTFKNEFALMAYAVAIGARPTFKEAASFSSVNLTAPTRLSSESGYSYSFRGWVAGSRASDEWSSGQTCLATALPPVTGDAVYTALYEKIVAKMTVNFTFMAKGAQGSYAEVSNSETNFDWTKDALSVANKRERLGSTFRQGNVTYTMLGWSTRKSDVEPMYSTSVNLAPDDSSFQSSTTLYAVHSREAGSVDVEFYIKGALYSRAENVAPTATVNTAFLNSSKPAAPTMSGYVLDGWSTTEGATTSLYGNVSQVGSLVTDSSTVKLYAVWRVKESDRPTVTFYDSDRAKVLLTLTLQKGQTVYDVYDQAYKPPAKDGYVFLRWIDEVGSVFSTTSTAVTHDTDVYAVYRAERHGSRGTASASALGANADSATRARTGAAAASAVSGADATRASNAGGSRSSSGSNADRAAGAAGANNSDGDSQGPTSGADGGSADQQAGFSVDGNVVGFVVAQLALVALAGWFIYWLFARRLNRGEKELSGIVAPETEAIRF